MPERVLKNINEKILPQWRVCFFTALIIGLAAHLYKLINWLPNWDSIVFRYDSQNMLRLGRWLLGLVCMPTSYYDLPWINGLFAVIFHSVGAVCICRIFDIKKYITAALIGAVVITFPTVTSVMIYSYVADGYAASFMLACLAAVFMTKDKPEYILSSILIMMSAGIYQAYITVTVTLVLIYLIDELIFKKESARQLGKKTLKCAGAGILGVTLYYIAMLVLLKITGETLLEYQGVNSAVSASDIDIMSSLYVVKHTFIGYFFDFSRGINAFPIINCIVFILITIFYIINIAAKKTYKNIGKILLLAAYIFLLPIGAAILAFINSEIDYHNLMKMGYCTFYIMFILIYERTDFGGYSKNAVKSWTVLGIGAILAFNQIIIANVSYHKLQMSYEKSMGTLIRIADRIEQTDGSENCGEILVIGSLPGSRAYSDELPPDITGTTDGYILRFDDEVVGQSVMCSAINDYCGKNYGFIFGDEKKAMMEKEEIKNMNEWPGNNSVSVVDGIIVIKLGAEGE